MPQAEAKPLTISGLSKYYGSQPALAIGELCLKPGLIHALIGPNGSGKSTLLRLLAGVLSGADGPARFSESLRPPELAYLPQKPYVFAFSVLKNVMLAAEGLPEEQARQSALSALEKVGLLPLAQRRADTLSGGEAQRLVFARMIVLPRKLLLLDEPTSATDIVGNDLLEDALRNFVAQTGCTVLFSTHAPAQALRLADEVIALDQGRIAEQGPARQLLTEPQNQRVAQFLAHWRLT